MYVSLKIKVKLILLYRNMYLETFSCLDIRERAGLHIENLRKRNHYNLNGKVKEMDLN
jgi:hypothetical protein